MPLTEEQVRNIIRRGLDAGLPVEEIKAGIQRYMGGGGEPFIEDPIARLRSRFAGTAAIPTEAIAPIQEAGFDDLVVATLGNTVAGPFAGIGESLGLVEEGTRQGLRDKFEETRVNYLAEDPSVLRTAIAGLTEGAAELVPLAPGGALGKKVAGKLGGGIAGRLAGGATAGAAEGAVIAVGDTVGLEGEERLRQGALMMAAAAGLGTLGGIKAVSGPDHGAKDPTTRKYLETYVADDVAKRSGDHVQKLQQQWFDSLAPVERAGRATGDPKIAELTEIRSQAARTAEQGAMEPIQGRTRTIDGTETGEGLDQIFADMDLDTFHDVQAYGMARRNLELAERKVQAKAEVPYYKELLVEAEKAGDRVLAKQAKEALAKAQRTASIKLNEKGLQDSAELVEHMNNRYGTDPNTGEAAIIGDRAKRLTEFANRAVIDPLVEVGVFSKAQADTMKRQGDWYVPFIRAVEEMGRMEKLGMVEKGIGSAPVRGKRITRGLESEPGLRIKDIYQEIGERAIRVHAFARKQALRNHLADISDEFADDIGLEVEKVDAGAPGSTFRVFRDGELQHYAADKDLLQAIESLNFKEANWVLRSARAMTRLFRAGATLTPQFGFGNVARDQFTYGVYSKEGGIPFLGPARAMGDVWAHMLGHGGRTPEEWQAFMRSSGGHASFVEGDRFNVERHVELLKRRGQAGGAGRLKKLGRESKKNPLAPLQAMSAMLERPARFAEFKKRYKRALKEGRTPEEAEQLAGLAGSDVTLNFPRGGTIGRRWNLYEAFFNAMMQDVSKFSRAMKERPFKTSAKALGYITAPSMMAWAKYKDDEEYKSLPEWEKALFIHVHKRENGKFVRIPMPPGILGVMFSYLPRKVAEAFFQDEPDAMKDFFGELADQTPLGFVPMPGGINPAKDVALEALPTPIQPVMELVANRSPFFDRPIVSQRYSKLPPSEQKHWRTSGAAKFIAGAVNALGGQVSPIGVDHLINGYGAGLGRQAAALTGSDAGFRRKLEEDGIFRLPGVDRFLSSSPYGFGSQPVQDFYDMVDMVEEAERGLKRQSNQTRYEGFLQDHPEALYGKDVRKIRKHFSEFASWRDDTRKDKSLETWEREDMLLKIDQEVTRYAAEVMKSLHDSIRMDQAIMQEEVNATP